MFYIKITSYIPYPITYGYDIKASAIHVAITRAIKKYRREPRVARKKIANLIVSAASGGAIKPLD